MNIVGPVHGKMHNVVCPSRVKYFVEAVLDKLKTVRPENLTCISGYSGLSGRAV